MEKSPETDAAASYKLDRQIGFVLRRVTQRHLSIFGTSIPQMTPTQFAALAKLYEVGPISQNALGRLIAMDGATIKGVVDRLVVRGLLATGRDAGDRRRTIVTLTREGETGYRVLADKAAQISAETLCPLDASEQVVLLALLHRMT